MNTLTQLLATHGGPILFVVVLAEMLGLPVAAAPVIIAAGALAGENASSPAAAIAITIAACLFGDLIWFWLGRRRGPALELFFARVFRGRALGRGNASLWFEKYGGSAVAGAKFIPGVGFLMPALAGAFRVHFAKFMCFEVLGSVLYALFYVELGLIFSGQIIGAFESLARFTHSAATAALLLVLAFVTYKYARRNAPRATESDIATH